MPRDPRLYLEDIVGSISRIREYMSGMEYPQFQKDRKTQDAVVRNSLFPIDFFRKPTSSFNLCVEIAKLGSGDW